MTGKGGHQAISDLAFLQGPSSPARLMKAVWPPKTIQGLPKTRLRVFNQQRWPGHRERPRRRACGGRDVCPMWRSGEKMLLDLPLWPSVSWKVNVTLTLARRTSEANGVVGRNGTFSVVLWNQHLEDLRSANSRHGFRMHSST